MLKRSLSLDIAFWKEKKNLEGLSLRTVGLNIILQGIIFLYLCDNDTSWLILVSTFVGLVIEIWKIRRVLVIGVDQSRRSLFGLLPFAVYARDRNPPSKLRTQTDEYDATAFRYLGKACVPLGVGYAVYSLVYEQHKSVYSWVLGTAVGFVYAFGFITMTPQLFINYKLKSVAHMPWRTLVYKVGRRVVVDGDRLANNTRRSFNGHTRKALNTFVDDLFAFVIKMPWLHRLACFRDDLVFAVYIYQRWIYSKGEWECRSRAATRRAS